MPSPSRSATRKNSAKKTLTAAQKAEIRNSLARFNSAHARLKRVHRKFNATIAPSEEAMLAALKALGRQGGGTRRRRR